MSLGYRQQPGLACERCRRKKNRCDRQRPVCGGCSEADAACVFDDKRPQRGPKKGQLKALRTRVAILERRLVEEFDDNLDSALQSTGVYQPPGLDNQGPTPVSEISNVMESSGERPDVSNRDLLMESDSVDDMSVASPIRAAGSGENDADALLLNLPNLPSCEQSTAPPTRESIRQSLINGREDLDLVQADLDQLYFDRIHPVVPIIHKSRYFCWSRQVDRSEARVCLQSAMRTLAAAVSAQFQTLGDSLHADTKQALERLKASEQQSASGFLLEEIQAWLLLAIYEFMQKPQRHAMMTAGCAFRMIQVSRLYEVDAPDVVLGEFSAMSGDAWVEAEEKRRTFWMAYCLDRFAGLYGEWPLMLHEDDVRIRLPAPESNFENNRPVHIDLLPDAIAASGQRTLSPFSECIVLATVWGRCASHRRRSLTEAAYGNDSREFWARHEWLDNILEKRTRCLEQSSPAGSALVDPMLVFARMLAHSAVISLMDTMQAKPWPAGDHQLLLVTYKQRAVQVAREIVSLSKTVVQLSCFKAHPFLPSVLFHGSRCLLSHANGSEPQPPGARGPDGVEELLEVLRDLKNVNNMAKELLPMVESNSSRESCPPYDWVLSYLGG